MTWLSPERECVMAFYREKQTEITKNADALSRPVFDRETRIDLGKLIGRENVSLVEAIARFGNYGDSKEMLRARNDLAKEMKKHGHFPKSGKRTGAGLKEMVEDLTPVLRYFGLPLATGEFSKLVTALQIIGDGMGVPGDPRNELRKLRRLAKETKAPDRHARREAIEKGLSEFRSLDPNLRQAIRDAVKKGLSALRISPPP